MHQKTCNSKATNRIYSNSHRGNLNRSIYLTVAWNYIKQLQQAVLKITTDAATYRRIMKITNRYLLLLIKKPEFPPWEFWHWLLLCEIKSWIVNDEHKKNTDSLYIGSPNSFKNTTSTFLDCWRIPTVGILARRKKAMNQEDTFWSGSGVWSRLLTTPNQRDKRQWKQYGGPWLCVISTRAAVQIPTVGIWVKRNGNGSRGFWVLRSWRSIFGWKETVRVHSTNNMCMRIDKAAMDFRHQ